MTETPQEREQAPGAPPRTAELPRAPRPQQSGGPAPLAAYETPPGAGREQAGGATAVPPGRTGRHGEEAGMPGGAVTYVGPAAGTPVGSYGGGSYDADPYEAGSHGGGSYGGGSYEAGSYGGGSPAGAASGPRPVPGPPTAAQPAAPSATPAAAQPGAQAGGPAGAGSSAVHPTAAVPGGTAGRPPITPPRRARRFPGTPPWAPLAGALGGVVLGVVAVLFLADAADTFATQLALVFLVLGLGLLGASGVLLAEEVRLLRRRTGEAGVRPSSVEVTAGLLNGLTPGRLLLAVGAFVLFLAAYAVR